MQTRIASEGARDREQAKDYREGAGAATDEKNASHLPSAGARPPLPFQRTRYGTERGCCEARGDQDDSGQRSHTRLVPVCRVVPLSRDRNPDAL